MSPDDRAVTIEREGGDIAIDEPVEARQRDGVQVERGLIGRGDEQLAGRVEGQARRAVGGTPDHVAVEMTAAWLVDGDERSVGVGIARILQRATTEVGRRVETPRDGYPAVGSEAQGGRLI